MSTPYYNDTEVDSDEETKKYGRQRNAFNRGKRDIRRFKDGNVIVGKLPQPQSGKKNVAVPSARIKVQENINFSPVYDRYKLQSSNPSRTNTMNQTHYELAPVADSRKQNKNKYRQCGYCTCGSYDFEALREFASKVSPCSSKYDEKVSLPTSGDFKFFTDDVTIFVGNSDIRKYLFIFEFGCVVFFNFQAFEESLWINTLQCVACDIVSVTDGGSAYEVQKYGYSEYVQEDQEGQIICTASHNVITLSSRDINEKLSCAYALGQAVKLNVLESICERYIKNYTYIANSLKQGSFAPSRANLTKNMFDIFQSISEIDLSLQTFDSPSYFWSEGLQYVRIYEICTDFLDVKCRLDLLVSRLDILRDLFSILSKHSHASHRNRMYFIIIMFIIVARGISVVYEFLAQDLGLLNRIQKE